MHRAAIESIFGLKLGAQTLTFNPCLPSHWPQAELTLARDGRTMRFILLRAKASEILTTSVQWDALLLNPGQALHWLDLNSDTSFVIPLLAEE
jgi:cyclic beta-1,2-glucan synthetase